MADKDMMERLDMKTQYSKMSSTDQYFIKKAEELRVVKGTAQKSLRKKNLLVGGLAFAGVAAIYMYTIMAVKQEKFLDEYDDIHKK